MSSTQPDRADTPATLSSSKCNKCNNTEGDLRRCPKCETVAYCSNECLTADWSAHNKECAKLAGSRTGEVSTSGGASTSEGSVPTTSIAKPFTAIFYNNFLHDRPENETFNILIDMILVRMDDTSTYERRNMIGTIFNNERTSAPALRYFLRKAKAVEGLLPPWWTDEKTSECIHYGERFDASHSLRTWKRKQVMLKEWKDSLMWLKLGMLAERMCGEGLAGQSTEALLRWMMSQETGNSETVYDPCMPENWS